MNDTAPLFSFGIVADPQYAAIPPQPEMDRYYAESLGKLAEAITVFNAQDLAFVVTLGDLIDRDFENFEAILGCYDRLRHRSVLLPGNHDFSVEPQYLAMVYERLGLAQPWHDFSIGQHRFIVLDGNDVSTFAPGLDDPRRTLAQTRLEALRQADAINAQDWNGSFGDEQMAWLETMLEAAEARGEQVVLFCHYPLFPQNAHNLWNAPQVLALLTHHSCVRAWFCGHNHAGNYGVADHVHFVNFKGMVDTPDQNSFAIADVFDNRIEIRGFGREVDRSLIFRQ